MCSIGFRSIQDAEMGFSSSQQTCKVAINLGAQESLGLSLLQQEVRQKICSKLDQIIESVNSAPSLHQ